jgi:predicted DNA-binding ribbon-helix-helix protein
MIRRTMRVGEVRQTSIMLEAEFWAYLVELAALRRVPLVTLVNEVAAVRPRPDSLASALRVFALREARRRLVPPAR